MTKVIINAYEVFPIFLVKTDLADYDEDNLFEIDPELLEKYEESHNAFFSLQKQIERAFYGRTDPQETPLPETTHTTDTGIDNSCEDPAIRRITVCVGARNV